MFECVSTRMFFSETNDEICGFKCEAFPLKKPTPFFLYIFLLFFENVKARFGLTIGCSDLFALALAQPLEQVVKVDLEVVGAHAPHGLEEGALLLGVDLGICSSLNDLGVQMYCSLSLTDI